MSNGTSDASTIARPYARAYFETHKSDLALDSMSILSLAVSRADVQALLDRPAESSDPISLLKSLVNKLPAGVEALLQTLAAKKRLTLLPEVLCQVRGLQLQSQGIRPVGIESAVVLSDSEKRELETLLEKRLKTRVQTTYSLNPALIAGVCVQIGDRRLDLSVQEKLSQLKKSLL